jgi:hypothetical protein
MPNSATSAQLLRDSSQADIPCDVAESGMSFRSAHCDDQGEVPPEHRLMVALVRDSIRSILKYRQARDLRGRRLLAEETRWMLSNDMSWFCAFARVCEVLDLDPEAVRRSLGLVSSGTPQRLRRGVPRSTPRKATPRRMPC